MKLLVCFIHDDRENKKHPLFGHFYLFLPVLVSFPPLTLQYFHPKVTETSTPGEINQFVNTVVLDRRSPFFLFMVCLLPLVCLADPA